jgi:pilus assembly protein FimV
MARTPAKLITATALLGLPAVGLALGLGDIQLKSALNQPLDAQIEILGATPQDLEDLRAAVAGRETFSRYGLEYLQMLGTLRFSVERTADGRDVLRLTSPQPVTEPFLTFLIEADWTRGRLLREYTVLLDPPVFMPEPSAPVAVETPRSAAAQPAPAAGVIERQPEAAPAVTPAEPPVASTPAAEAPSASAPQPASTAQPAAPVEGEYRVSRGDTLWVIASRTRPDASTSLNQMMVALYRANPEAFLGNMNLIREGATLRIPASDEIGGVSSADAAAEFARQTDAWQGGATASVATDEQLKLVPPKADAETAPGGAASETAGAASGAATARIAQENATLAAQVKDLQRQLDEAKSRLQIQDAELARMEAELAAADQPAPAPAEPGATTAAGVDLEPEPVADDMTPVSDDVEVAPEPVSSEPVASEPEQAPAAAGTTPVAATEPPAESQPSWLDSILGIFGQTWVMILAGLALVAAAVGVALRKRKSAMAPLEALEPEPEPERVAPSLEPVAAGAAATTATAVAAGAAVAASKPRPVVTQVPASSDTGIFEITGNFRPVDFDTGPDTTVAGADATYPFEDSGSALAIDQSDPISEADFHMAYGLYDQASDLIRKALDREPGRQDLQLKLLEILFVGGNKDSFRERAEAFRGDLTRGGQWDKIVIMGKQICPGDALFESSGGAPADAGVDLDLANSAITAAPQPALRASDSQSLDFDLDEALSAKADLHSAETVPATGEYLEMAAKEEPQEVEDEQLTAVARRLEARMRPRAGDVGVALDLGETIAPEDVSSTRTFGEGTRTKKGDDDAFGDFFAFTGVAEAPEPDPTGTREVVIDFEGDMLPDSTTAEFKIELPEDGSGVDLDIGATAAHLPTLREDGEGDTTRVLTQGSGETTVVSSFGDTETVQSPGYVDPNARTVQAPRLSGSHNLLGGNDPTLSVDSLDLDVGLGGGADDPPATVRVSAADLALPEAEDGVLDEVGTKLDLARAYIDMGDPDGARSILKEVIEEGDESQRQNAHTLLRSIA